MNVALEDLLVHFERGSTRFAFGVIKQATRVLRLRAKAASAATVC